MNHAPSLKVKDVQLHILNMRTRFPFQYGIASLTALPHLFVRASVEFNDQELQTGLSADGLPPKWFTKNPNTRFEEDLPAFFDVINQAIRLAKDAPSGSFFQLWQHLYHGQADWAKATNTPPLIANLGVSLIERTVLDALCRHLDTPLHQAVQKNLLGIRFGEVRPELERVLPENLFGKPPLNSIHIRHTIGLGDPLTAEDVPADEQLNDSLPYTLEENIRAYGLSYFKIKVRGDRDADLNRLHKIADVLEKGEVDEPSLTLDGNEQFASVDAFRDFYEACKADTKIGKLFKGLLLVEQPLHRDVALEHDLREWKDRPPLIIDESEGALESLPKALELGYTGTSHKNCKGIVKGLANAALLEVRKEETGQTLHLTAEDLANVGPIALNQDLAMVALLGISHAERNGHHYFRGLSMFLEDLWTDLTQTGLYHRPENFPTLHIQDGSLNLESINQAPFGTQHLLDSTRFTPVADWEAVSLA